MDEISKIFEVNNKVKLCKISNGGCDCTIKSNQFGAKEILDIISFVNGVHKKYKNVNVPLYFNFGTVEIIDKLSYVIFECLCYSLIKDYKHAVAVSWKPENTIKTQGVFSSPLKILNEQKAKCSAKYLKKFEDEIYGFHFRRVISVESGDDNYVGELQQEVNAFLSTFYIREDYIDDIVQMIGEVVGNVYEHTGSKCLLDIDVTTDHKKEVEEELIEGSYYGVNIVILNFSDVLLGDRLKKRIEERDLTADDRYIKLRDAYNYHSSIFSEEYTMEDFCNIASLQHKISGNPKKGKAGGRGLTTLIRSLQEKSDTDNCYVLSGNRIVLFQKEMLKYDEEEWLGFNVSKNFFSEPPNKGVINDCIVCFPGTAYNLNFVLKREEK